MNCFSITDFIHGLRGDSFITPGHPCNKLVLELPLDIMKTRELMLSAILLIFFQLSDRLALKYDPIINSKFFFGLFFNNGTALAISLLMLILAFYLVSYLKAPLIYFFIISSAVISNCLDRFFYGGVIDYINPPYFYAFNIADVFIVAMILILPLVKKQKNLPN